MTDRDCNPGKAEWVVRWIRAIRPNVHRKEWFSRDLGKVNCSGFGVCVSLRRSLGEDPDQPLAPHRVHCVAEIRTSEVLAVDCGGVEFDQGLENRILQQAFPGDELNAISWAKRGNEQWDIPIATMASDDNVSGLPIEHIPPRNPQAKQNLRQELKEDNYQRVQTSSIPCLELMRQPSLIAP